MDAYEKKYKETLNKAKKELDTCGSQDCDAARQIFRLFPELKESEDEKVRKALITFFQRFPYERICDAGTNVKEAIAWLEKQGEQIDIANKEYWRGYREGKQEILDKYAEIEKQGEQKSIINVPSREIILAIWDLGNEWKELTNGSISTEYGTQLDYIQKHWQESEYYLRAMQDKQKPIEMKSAEESLGIDSDTYNKIIDECIFGEQEPAGKVEPKFKVGDKIYLKPEYRMPDDDTPIANTVFEIRAIDDKYYRFDGSYIFIEDQDKYELVEQKPSDEEMKILLRTEYEKGRADAIAKMQGEWSEEDELKMQAIIDLLPGLTIRHNWLKSLKGRVQPQNHWKPSDEQMKALNYVVNLMASSESPKENDYYYNVFRDLRKQLKKLKENSYESKNCTQNS